MQTRKETGHLLYVFYTSTKQQVSFGGFLRLNSPFKQGPASTRNLHLPATRAMPHLHTAMYLTRFHRLPFTTGCVYQIDPTTIPKGYHQQLGSPRSG